MPVLPRRLSPACPDGGVPLSAPQIDYLGALRRGALAILAFAVLAGAVAILVPVSKNKVAPPKGGLLAPVWEASALIGPPGGTTAVTIAPTAILSLLRSAPVERATTATAALPAYDAGAVGQATSLTGKKIDGILEGVVTAKASTRPLAIRLANGATNALISQLNAQAVAIRTAQLAADRKQLAYLQSQIHTLESELLPAGGAARSTATTDPAVVRAQVNAISAAYTSEYDAYLVLESSPAPTAGISVLAPATTASSVTPPSHTSALRERRVRGPIGFGAGLCAAMLAVLVLAQFDRRLRGRAAAESAFGLPVLVEIPPQRLRRGPADVVVRAASADGAAEAYRTLHWALMARFSASSSLAPADVPASPAVNTGPAPLGPFGGQLTAEPARLPQDQPDRAPAFAIVSPSAEPTRRVVVANAAAAAAEAGLSVLVLVSEPGGNAGTNRRFARPAPEGANADGGNTALAAPTLTDITRETTVPGVRRADVRSDHVIGALIEDARLTANLVLVDGGGVLTSHYAASLAHVVDGMALVGEVGWTTAEQASRATALLEQLEAPLLGVVLAQAPSPVSRRARRRSRAVLAEAPTGVGKR
jgi:hypothetical protein